MDSLGFFAQLQHTGNDEHALHRELVTQALQLSAAQVQLREGSRQYAPQEIIPREQQRPAKTELAGCDSRSSGAQ